MAGVERVAAIVVAAGKGERMGGGVKKQFRLLGGRPVLHWSLQALEEATPVDEVIVVTAEADVEDVQQEVSPRFSKVRHVVAGGATRQESVARGLAAVSERVGWVIVHDGVRPLADADLFEQVLRAARTTGAATVALPVKETVKEVGSDGLVVRTLDRSRLWSVQTPQAFARELLERAHAQGPELEATDDCALVEALGEPVAVVWGSERNLKLTTPGDLRILETLVGDVPKGQGAGAAKPDTVFPATGLGFDVHRLVPGRPLILGGVRIPHAKGLLGHSDADVLTHAVIDALLGAASLGDIGRHFPDTDPAYRGADSLALLEKVKALVTAKGASIVHVDAFISAEKPRLSPYIEAMRANLAHAMEIDIERVNVKAGTGEGMGPVGTEEAIEARAVATLLRRALPAAPSPR